MRPLPALLLLASILVAPLTARAADIRADALNWTVDDIEFSGYLVYAKGTEPRPGIVMVPN